MISYVALLVGYNTETKSIIYGAVEIISEDLPNNDTRTIMEVVKLSNGHKDLEPHIKYIDMYGYEYDDERFLWEISGTEEEFGGLHYD